MDNLTDIESIILSQNWKKSKTTVGSPQPKSPIHGVKQKQSPHFSKTSQFLMKTLQEKLLKSLALRQIIKEESLN